MYEISHSKEINIKSALQHIHLELMADFNYSEYAVYFKILGI